jgi:hypothetical protein
MGVSRHSLFVLALVGACGHAYSTANEGRDASPQTSRDPTEATGATPDPDASTNSAPLDAGKPAVQIHCGLGTICGEHQSCCITGTYGDCQGVFTCGCTPVGACISPLHYECDDPSDCASGLVCCGTYALNRDAGGLALQRASCLAPTSCATDGVHFQLCDPTSATSTCPSGLACKPSKAFPGVGACD